MPNTTPYRVVQWTTGNVGKSSVEALAKNPNYELVGCYAWSKDKDGVDVGELAGIEPLGVAATNDVDALLALKPDCVVYNPMWIDVDELVRILSAGVNVVASASFITGQNLGDGSRPNRRGVQAGRLDDVRLRRQPGLRRTARHRCGDRLRPGGQGHHRRGVRHHVLRLTRHRDGRPASACRSTTPICSRWRRRARPCSPRRCSWSPTSLGVELDEIVCEAEYAQTTEDLDLGSWTIKAGHVAGVFASWQGRVGGKTVVDLNVRWRKGQTLDPDWKVDGDPWKITIEGLPTVTMQVGFLPPPDFIENAKTIEDFMGLGHIITAMPPIHAIPAVVAAAPGIATYNDLVLPQARGVVPTA